MTTQTPATATATASTVGSVTSKDGTRIAYERTGAGPALILVDGAMCSRAMGPMAAIAQAMSPHFTVYRYDRRGRGESGDTLPYAIEREVEDLAALIREAGGSAHLFGVSSGGALALEAANQRLGVGKLAVFEVPFIVDDTRDPVPADYLATLEDHIAHGRNGAALKMFLASVGMPGFMRWLMPLLPAWSRMLAIAPTLAYDTRLVAGEQTGKPLARDRWAQVSAPTLVIDGGKSPAWMRHAARAIANVLPGATHQTLPGQTHAVKAEVLAPALVAFFRA
ncbi:MAG: alpha/beta fold hydrolase [Candidatus Sericytochromatia bacterium]